MKYIPRQIINPPNVVTIIRIAMIFGVIALINIGSPGASFTAAAVCAVVFSMDRLDGFLANRLNCKTEFGGVLDVAGDRIVENVLWILFAVKGLLPIWMPIIVISRGFLVDGFRSFALSKGFTTFAMMQPGLGQRIVASPVSRLLYGVLKMALFIGAFILYGYGAASHPVWVILLNVVAVFVVLYCLVRGIFSIKDVLPLFNEPSDALSETG